MIVFVCMDVTWNSKGIVIPHKSANVMLINYMFHVGLANLFVVIFLYGKYTK